MNYEKDFSQKAITYIGKVKVIEKDNREELDKLSLEAYADYRNGKLSEKEYGHIHALLMEYRYPR